MMKKFNREEAIMATGVSQNGWRKSNREEKKVMFERAGYVLRDTSREGTSIMYFVEEKGQELVKVRKMLMKIGFAPSSNTRAIINCLIAWDNNLVISAADLAEQNGVGFSTINYWKNKLADAGVLAIEEKAIKVKIKGGHQTPCTEKEWKAYTNFLTKQIKVGLDSFSAWVAWRNITGYTYKKINRVKPNGFYNELFCLLDKAAEQVA